METRSNAAAAFFTLSALIPIRLSFARLPLVELLDQGSSVAKKDAAAAIFNLCIMHDNRARAVRNGAIRVLLETILDESAELVDECLAILAILSSSQQALEEVGRNEGTRCMLDIMRNSTSGRNRENAVAVLHAVCWNDRMKFKEVREEEAENGSLTVLSQNGTLRAWRKTVGILETKEGRKHSMSCSGINCGSL